ncbi:MAG: sulfite exporter TauE/SafE family protein [Pseudomonadota bacterium]
MTILDNPAGLAAIFIAISLGSIVKGATGAGTPVVAVPVIAAFFDIRLGVAIMAVINVFSNLWQVWQFRDEMLDRRFTLTLVVGAAVGTVLGTLLLVELPERVLGLLIAAAVIFYIALRLLSPSFKLDQARAFRLAGPMSVLAGVMQGATGISAPITVAFVNAMRLARPVFVFTVSCFFGGMAVVQVPVLWIVGILTWESLLVGLVGLVPMTLFMMLGERISRRLSPKAFDRVILVFLSLLATRLIYGAIFT